MTTQSARTFPLALLLISPAVLAQDIPQQNPVGATALSGVVLQQDFGDYKFQKREIVTIANNARVPGLGGLAFVYYKNAGGERIMLSIQWFDDSKKLLAFFDDNLKMQLGQPEQKGLAMRKVDGNTVWANGDKIFYWTDTKNFMVSGGGSSVPAEMLKAYLKAVPGREPGKTNDDKKEE